MKLKNVTLVCLEGVDNADSINTAVKALQISSRNLNFGEIVLISPEKPSCRYDDITHYSIDKLTWIEYNQFILKNLIKYINTDYCVLIQTDGFILNSELWSDEFLKYDYIGHAFDFINCPWQVNGVNPEVVNRKGIHGLNRVGNGGFSFRSKKFLIETANCPYECNGPEDVFISNDYFDYFIEKGIKYAPVEIADLFSKDASEDISKTFGFHGDKNLVNILMN
jgi:hypothetical protein